MYWCFLTLKIQIQVLVYVRTKKINESFYKLASVLSDTAANCCLLICYKSSWPGQNRIVLFIILVKIIFHDIKHEIYIKIVKCQKLGPFIFIYCWEMYVITLNPREKRSNETYGKDTQDLLTYLCVRKLLT